MDLDFCIVCLKQTMGGLYCSSSCRTEDYANAAKAAMASANASANGKGIDINTATDQFNKTYASYAVGYKPFHASKFPSSSHDLCFRQSSTSSQHSQHNIFAMRDDSTDNWTDESDTSAESGTNSTFSRVSQDIQGPGASACITERPEVGQVVVVPHAHKNSTFHSYQSLADIEPTIIQPGDKEDSLRYPASAASHALAGILSKSSTHKPSRISSWLFSV